MLVKAEKKMERANVVLRTLVLMLIFLIPLQNIIEKFPKTNIEGLNLINLLFGSIYFGIFCESFKTDKKIELKSSLKLPIFLYATFIILSIVFIGSEEYSNTQMIKYYKEIIINLSLFFITHKCLKTKKDIILCFVVMAVANIYMDIYFWREVRWVEFEQYSYKFKRIYGTFGAIGGSNEWAAFFSTYTFVSLSIGKNMGKKIVKIGSYSLSFVNILVMLYTFSRGAYVGFAGGLILYSITSKQFRYILFISILTFAYTIILPSVVVERIEMSFDETMIGDVKDQDVASRLEMWEYAKNRIKSSFFFGNGFRSFFYKNWRNPHNEHLNILFQFGLIGYGLFLWIFLAAMYEAKRLLDIDKKSDFSKSVAEGWMAGIIALFLANLFGDRWNFVPLTGYFWVINGLVYSLIKVEKENVSEVI